MNTAHYDYIIIGAGSSGCVTASRLSEDPKCRVLLIEAGGKDSNPWIHIPLGFAKSLFNPNLNWRYQTQPEPFLHNRVIEIGAGKVLGGSSSINGMVYIRGQHADYDHWESLGNTGWSWKDVKPFFLKSEKQERGASSWHGDTGPLHVSNTRMKNALCDAFVASAAHCGIPVNEDFNGAQQEGAGYFQFTTKNGFRHSSAASFLRIAKRRANLTIVTAAYVDRVGLLNHRAHQVFYIKDGQSVAAIADNAIVLCAGALGSPAILMRSGIGDATKLEKAGVSVRHELKGVGENLQDHLQIKMIFKSSVKGTLNDLYPSFTSKLGILKDYALHRKGWLSNAGAQAGAFVKSAADCKEPDIQFHAAPFSALRPQQGLDKFPGFTFSSCQLRPASRGSLTIQSAQPTIPPVVQFNYLSEKIDRDVMVRGLEIARQVAATGPLKTVLQEEMFASKELADASPLELIKRFGSTVYHPAGSCKMGIDGMSVVDPMLKVYGVEGLYVADNSIMPTLVSGNTNAPAIMLGERVSEFIKAAQ